MQNRNRQWILKKPPIGELKLDDLVLIETPDPLPSPGQTLIRTLQSEEP